MAKQSGSEKLKAQLGLQLTGIKEEFAKLKPYVEQLGAVLPHAIRDGLKDTEKDILKMGALLDEATTMEGLETARVAMGGLADQAAKVSKEIAKSAGKRNQFVNAAEVNKGTESLKRLGQELKNTQKQTQRTSLASQNMLRVIQDSPFGMLGMANNIQMLGEDISRGLAKGTSAADTLKAGLKNLIMGPMAIAGVIAVGTLIIQKWDKIQQAGIALRDMLDGVVESQRAFNQAVNEFEGSESFKKFVDSLNNEDARSAREAVDEQINALVKLNPELMKLDPEKIKRQGNALDLLFSVMGQSGIKGSVVAGGAEGAMVNQFLHLRERQRMLNDKIQADVREDGRKKAHNIELEDDKEAKKLEESAAKKLQKELDLLEKLAKQRQEAEQKYADKRIADGQRELERFLDQGEDDLQVMIREDARRIRERAKAMSEAMKSVRQGIRMGDLSANAIGAGMAGGAAFGSGHGARMAYEDQKASNKQAALQAKIDARGAARGELEALKVGASDAEKAELQLTINEIIAQEEALGAAQVAAVEDAERKKAAIREQYRKQEVAAIGAFAGSMGDIFGGMSTLMEKEGKDGMQKNKAMLKAQAWAQAISASVSIFNQVASTPGLGPFSLAAAGAAMASTMVTLGAQIKKIDNPGNGSGSSGGAAITGGHYSALNSRAGAMRANQYQKAEDRRNAAGAQGATATQSNTETLLSNINDGIRTQQVVIDQSTIATVTRDGNSTNQRRVQTSA